MHKFQGNFHEITGNLPCLELFSAKWMWDVFDGITQAVSVVVRRIDTPATKKPDHSTAETFEVGTCEQVRVPGVSSAMMRRELDSVSDRILFSILQRHLHPQRGNPLINLTSPHVLKQAQWLFDGSVAPGWGWGVVTFDLVALLMADVCEISFDEVDSEIVKLLKVIGTVRHFVRSVPWKYTNSLNVSSFKMAKN